MFRVVVAGAGKIGSLIACLLAKSADYDVYILDQQFNGQDIVRLKTKISVINLVEVDIENQQAVSTLFQQLKPIAVISSLPYYCNISLAQLAKQFKSHYFDLTEDVSVTAAISDIAADAKTAFVPQCGLAPGLVNIIAHDLMQHFDSLDTVKLRVGALPQQASNALKYALTWSTDGLINEYGNACHVIEHGKEMLVPALEGLETLEYDGEEYEAFNTSGGLGNLAKTYAGKVQTLNYKTLRYPGHCEKIKFLMNDLKLNDDRATLKRILENALPKTYQDVVLIYVSVIGRQQNQLLEKSYIKKIYPKEIADLQWSAIQLSTAAGICTVIDLVLHDPEQYQGLVTQEQFSLQQIVNNRFSMSII